MSAVNEHLHILSNLFTIDSCITPYRGTRCNIFPGIGEDHESDESVESSGIGIHGCKTGEFYASDDLHLFLQVLSHLPKCYERYTDCIFTVPV